MTSIRSRGTLVAQTPEGPLSAADSHSGGLPPISLGNRESMLRKALWMGLYGALGAAATMAARRAASGIWRVATGEKPPAKR
jgi:hypothetical protein